MISRLKLLKVTYSKPGKFDEYKYHFEGNIRVTKWYLFPFTRLQSEMLVFKVPFMEARFFLLDVMLSLFITVMIIKPMLIITYNRVYHADGDYVEAKTGIALLSLILGAFFFSVFTYYVFTHYLAIVLTYYYGKKSSAVVRRAEEFKDSEDRSRCNYTVELPDETRVVLSDLSMDEFVIGQEIPLMIHPDDAPGVAYKGTYRNHVILFIGVCTLPFFIYRLLEK